ncbi:MAG: DUF349 domain-containing protein [Kofleriaceae bacterium]
MGIADLFRPKYRHSDVRVRAEAVRALTHDDAAILVQVARTDRDIGVRRLAIGKIHEAAVLADIAAGETERSLRDFAGERAAELWQDTASGDDAEAAGAALTGIIKLGDQHPLVEVAAHATLPAIRKRAFGELRDPRALAELAKGDAPQELRLAAVARIDDGDVLRALAIDTTQKEVGLAAVDKLDDIDRLENVAHKAKNKAIRQRARKIATEMAEAERKKLAPVVSDEVKRLRAERVQLIREVENVADSFDFERATPIVERAQAAWKALAASDEGHAEATERFDRSAERFFRRRELHQSQARTADELRAVEREAVRERALAAERTAAAKAATPAPMPAAPEEVDPARRAAEAAERDQRRAAAEVAEAAEREVRKQEDAERGAAIAQSLTALADDLDKLDSKDPKQIERALQQAAKAFEAIGRVAADQREVLSDRYAAARGKLVERVNELHEAEDWARFQNVPKAEALIATAKVMAAEEPSQDLANRLRQLQALWKEVGPMPQRRSKELWEQFKLGCDAVYERVRGLRAVENEKFAEVVKAKEALIAEADALAAPFASADPNGSAPGDWAATADQLKALQGRWKDSGHLPRKQGDELWKRFRAACDTFFERRKPLLDARHAEEGENLAKKQALIARAQHVALKAPDDGGWGKAIGQIKDLQREWKDIGFVPRRDADAVYKAFRAACDSLFAKRDDARDSEANTHRAELDALKAELDAVRAADRESPDRIARAIAVRAKVRELDRRELSAAVEDMVRDVIASSPDAVKGTELDPAALRARRDKLIARAQELLPKTAAAPAGADLAAQLKNAMRSNAFGDLRFSGRDPIEVIDELRAQWADAGPLLDDADRAQAAGFEAVAKQVLDAAGPRAEDRADHGDRPERTDRNERGERGERRRRRERNSAELPIANAPAPAVAPAVVPAVVAAPAVPAVPPAAAAPVALQTDTPTAPAKIPFAPLPPPPIPAPPVVAEPAAEVALPRTKSVSTMPPLDELDTGWDLGEDDPTAGKPEPETTNTPSSSEMAGDGAPGGDGIDEPGWD